ncbi:TPA: DNA circularization N-terminal domain-containing protein [Klebsiella pneumoniae]|nr:DNA circularization N-terminal domain-containing protein [Klebsiella pneumoniae]ELA0627908.1 DNA circularization N-terminal domain-containing protein [Klebsiella pneumoniae]MBC4125386.1 DNA circularization N-terminal domain-containing protein [Klebsiella pneumoniae]MCD9656146.1 DNA circularization N-terminal domain-containing protein [Klebsiella pneumoniae]MCD9741393.1 DNA circularization N-terminal domain-containing protein [Klebsiella pneumoniae]
MSDYRSVIATGSGSFRGVPFLIAESVSERGGRRTVRREYPRRDDGGADDLGRRLRERSFSCLVLGDDYIDQKNALIEALDADGPGELVHPLYGTLQAQIDTWESQEDLGRQGLCAFQITFLPPMEATAPVAKRDTVAASKTAANEAIDRVSVDFTSVWNADGLSLHDTQSLIAGVTQAVNSVSDVVSSSLGWVDGVQSVLAACSTLRGSAQSLINAPAYLAAELTSVIAGIRSLGNFSDVTSAYDALLSRLQVEPATSTAGAVATAADSADGVLFVSPVSQQARESLLALDVLTYDAVLVNAAVAVTDSVTAAQSAATARTLTAAVTGLELADEAAATTTAAYNSLESRAVVISLAQSLGTELDAQVLSASELGWGVTAQRLQGFRLIWLHDMRERAEQLPAAISVTPATTETAFVTLFRATGDSRSWETFTRRNDLVNPLFVPGGQPVEVLISE